jgi:hypothetical protein
MADLGLLSGIATGLKSAMSGYQDAERYKAEKEKQATADALQKKMTQLSMLKSGYEDSPEGLVKTASAQDQEDLEKRYKEAQISKMYAETGGEKMKKAGPDQFKAASFAHRLRQAEEIFKDLEKRKFNPASRSFAIQKSSFYPEELMSDQAKEQSQAERNFVNSVLRRESGAAISPSEFTSAEKQYFPRPGDSKDVLKQKELNRGQVFEGLKAESLGAYDKIPAVPGLIASSGKEKQKSGGLIRSAMAADSAPPDFDNMTLEELRKFNAGK